MKAIEEMGREELDALVLQIEERRKAIKLGEIQGLIDSLRPGKWIHIKKGKKGEKIGKVLLIGEDFVTIKPLDLDYKLKVPYLEVEEVYDLEETARGEWNKHLESKNPPKVEPAKEVQKEVVPEKKPPFGRRK
jgi:hypothetical protein